MNRAELLDKIAMATGLERGRRDDWQVALAMRNRLIREADAAGVPQHEIAAAALLSAPQVLRIAAGDGRGAEE